MSLAKVKTFIFFAIYIYLTFLPFINSTKRRQSNQDGEFAETGCEECETCKLTNEVEEVQFKLRNCENELEDLKQKVLSQSGVESSSSLSYLGQVCSWVTSSNKRSSSLRSTVQRFLQTLQIDNKKSPTDLDDVHQAHIRYFSVIRKLPKI